MYGKIRLTKNIACVMNYYVRVCRGTTFTQGFRNQGDVKPAPRRALVCLTLPRFLLQCRSVSQSSQSTQTAPARASFFVYSYESPVRYLLWPALHFSDTLSLTSPPSIASSDTWPIHWQDDDEHFLFFNPLLYGYRLQYSLTWPKIPNLSLSSSALQR